MKYARRSIHHFMYLHGLQNGRTYARFHNYIHITVRHGSRPRSPLPKANSSKPNDEKERDQQDLLHHIWGLILKGKLYKAPIRELGNTIKILDIGTGTGIWAMDFAEYVLSFELVHCMVTDALLVNFPMQRCWVDSLSAFPILSTTSNYSILQASTLAICSQICKLCPAEFQLCKNCPTNTRHTQSATKLRIRDRRS